MAGPTNWITFEQQLGNEIRHFGWFLFYLATLSLNFGTKK
jgi:hypothetical protein